MKQLTDFEKEMITIIVKYNPYSREEVNRVYLNEKSFDNTIFILKLSNQFCISMDVLHFDLS